MGLTFCSLSIAILSLAQVNPVEIGVLPNSIDEASGLQYTGMDTCWTFNDNADGARIYAISPDGTFIRQLTITGADQVDFEDISIDDQDRIYIGDFGNNNSDRTDLGIYRLSDPDLITGTTINSEFMEFTYSDQTEFPPPDSDRNYDVEAMIHHDNELFLFTRNRTVPYNGLTKIYRMDASLPNQIAQYQGEFLGALSEPFYSVTGADISPSGNRIALLTSGSIILLTDIDFSDLANSNRIVNFFNTIASYEGISFIDDCNVLIVEEGSPANVFQLNTCDIVSGISDLDNYLPLYSWTESYIEVSQQGVAKMELIDLNGRILAQSRGPILHTSAHFTGTFILRISMDSGSPTSQLVNR